MRARVTVTGWGVRAMVRVRVVRVRVRWFDFTVHFFELSDKLLSFDWRKVVHEFVWNFVNAWD